MLARKHTFLLELRVARSIADQCATQSCIIWTMSPIGIDFGFHDGLLCRRRPTNCLVCDGGIDGTLDVNLNEFND